MPPRIADFAALDKQLMTLRAVPKPVGIVASLGFDSRRRTGSGVHARLKINELAPAAVTKAWRAP